MDKKSFLSTHHASILAGAVALFGLYLTSLYDYLLFHSVAELFGILVAFVIFIIAWNTRSLLDNNYLLFIGIAYLFVGMLDLLHTLTYKGMGVLASHGANLPTQLWIAGRYTESVSLLAAPMFFGRRLSLRNVSLGYTTAFLLVLISIFHLDIFPDCFVEGVGLTTFKKNSEYIICLILVGSGLLLFKNRAEFEGRVFKLLVSSIALTIVSELAFTSYVNVYGFANLVGHLLKIVSFYLIYRAIVVTGLVEPYNLMFRNLKQSEGALRKAHEGLEIRVRERTEELQRANEALQTQIEERLKAEQMLKDHSIKLEWSKRELEDFVFAASHHLQEPLRKIQTFGDRLRKRYHDMLDGEGLEDLHRMRKAASRMRELIESLGTYSQAGISGEPWQQAVDIDKLVREILTDLEPRITEARAVVELGDLPTIHADPSQMRQLFFNLLENALKYRKEDHSVIRVYSRLPEEPADRTELKPQVELCEIVVEDNGIGFDEKYLDRIFTPFQRLHRPDTFTGTGIGLAICRKIVVYHGGSIKARSKPGRGAAFVVTLPRDKSDGEYRSD